MSKGKVCGATSVDADAECNERRDQLDFNVSKGRVPMRREGFIMVSCVFNHGERVGFPGQFNVGDFLREDGERFLHVFFARGQKVEIIGPLHMFQNDVCLPRLPRKGQSKPLVLESFLRFLEAVSTYMFQR